MKTNQKHTLHRFGALLLALAMTFALAGCGSKTFDASGYVDASLKQVTTGDTKGLEAYKGQAVVTTAEDYDKELQDMIESITGSMELSESNLNLVKDLVKELLGNASYQVGEATEQDDGSFEVPLTIKPLQLNIIQGTAVQYRDIGVTAKDQIIGLSTCSEAVTNGRVVLFGRLDK